MLMQMPPKSKIVPLDLLTDELLRRGLTRTAVGNARRFIRFVAPDGTFWLTSRGFIKFPFVSGVAHAIAKSKLMAQDFAKECGMPVLETIVLPEEAERLDGFLRQHGPVVVKPANSHGSQGVTLDVMSRAQLDTAVALAQKYAFNVLVQRQFMGSEIRLTVLEGKVVSAILRQTPRVVGDGSQPIASLIARENELRVQFSDGILPYPQLDATLIDSAWFHDARVPAIGEIVELSRATMVSRGASFFNVTSKVHQSYKDMAVRLAASIDTEFLTVDLLVDAYDVPASAGNYVFLECNTTPSLKLYFCRRGEPDYDIIPKLADMIVASVKSNRILGNKQ
jgi:D-alanine-D-alanine ligase-like ATP-grasp enzyme